MKSAMRAVLAAVLVLAVGMPISTSFAEAKSRPGASRVKAKKPTRRARAVRVAPKPDAGFLARDAYYSGDIQKAYELAPAAGERWVAALASWRLGMFDEALEGFTAVATDSTSDAWIRSGANFWAARAAVAAGRTDQQADFLKAAATSPWTFYGMIAEAQLGLNPVVSFAQIVASPDILAAESLDPMAQLIRASTAELVEQMAPIADIPGFNPSHYPVPSLIPEGGFTMDPALVYALIRQESRFNAAVVSPVGAVGLMQLMPATAAITGGDTKFRSRDLLRDPAVNMRLGQDYLNMLATNLVGDDMLMVIAAYNGGPGAVTKTMDRVGWGADPLLMIESLPAKETRDYVEKVMAGYWIYRRQFGQETPSLKALADGGQKISLALDRNGATALAAASVPATVAVASAEVEDEAPAFTAPTVSAPPVASDAASFTVGAAF